MHHALSVKLNGKNHVSKTDLFTDCTKAVDLIVKGMEGAINAKTVTYDFERLMEGAKLLKCSEFGETIIENM